MALSTLFCNILTDKLQSYTLLSLHCIHFVKIHKTFPVWLVVVYILQYLLRYSTCCLQPFLDLPGFKSFIIKSRWKQKLLSFPKKTTAKQILWRKWNNVTLADSIVLVWLKFMLASLNYVVMSVRELLILPSKSNSSLLNSLPGICIHILTYLN